MTTQLAPRERSERRGFTLVELMVTLVMLSVVMGTISMVLVRQQRFYAGIGSVIQTRSQVRQALGLLPGELRALSPSQNDIYAMTDSSIEFRAIVGSSILCAKSILTANAIMLPPLSLARGNTLTTWLSKPVVGDSILVLDEGVSALLGDDVWQARRITVVDSATGFSGCSSTTKYTTSADASKQSPKLTLSASLGSSVKTGAPIRFFRRAHYSFYKTPANQWFLGYFDCLPPATGTTPVCSAMMPVSGPYRPYAAPNSGTSGLTFSYFDSTGTQTTDKTKVARIDIVVRGESKRAIWTSEKYRDSITVSIGIRNRN
jgi:prepilin-type N-terminal cleavage/methylation domain-containing protein